MQGVVTDIQRFSLNDGPGIRTTVFLKGCNMKCAWCHNPETLRKKREIHYYSQNCIRCYKCVTACTCKAHKKIAGEHHYYPQLCVQCGRCAEVCYAEAMVVSGKPMPVEEIMREVLQDKAYYASSGGGVTLSGGEVLCQQPVAEELVRACKAEGIPVAIETNLSLPYDEIYPLLKELELVLCDLKIADSEAHKLHTGLDNAAIFENIRRMNADGIPFVVRTPLIPNVTDTDENIRAIAEFLQDMQGMRYYELLNFNPLGDSKYRSLSRKNPYQNTRPLPDDRLAQLKALAESFGIPVRVE